MYQFYSELGKKVNIRISVDGYGEAHDVNRKTADGRGSWALVKKNLPAYRELMEKYKVKTNIVATLNRASIEGLFDNSTKIYEITRMPVAFLFVHEEDWTPKDFEKIKEQVSRLHDYSIRNGTRFGISNIEAIRQGNNNSQGFQSICGAGIASITVNYQGGIYPCHRCCYNDMGDFYKMGSLDTGISYARRAFINEINNLDMLPSQVPKVPPCYPKKLSFLLFYK